MPFPRGLLAVLRSSQNIKWRPSGKNHGQRCPPTVIAVTGVALPPAADTRSSGPAIVAKRMTSSWFQVPPSPSGASVTFCTFPLARSSAFSWRSAKNAMLRLSGAQKG